MDPFEEGIRVFHIETMEICFVLLLYVHTLNWSVYRMITSGVGETMWGEVLSYLFFLFHMATTRDLQARRPFKGDITSKYPLYKV